MGLEFQGSNRGRETQARLTVKVLGQPEEERESTNARTEGCVAVTSESSCGCCNRHIPRGNLTQKENGSPESQCMGGIRDFMRNALTVGCSWQDFLTEKFSVTMSFLALKKKKTNHCGEDILFDPEDAKNLKVKELISAYVAD